MSASSVPSSARAVLSIASVTLRRMRRGRAQWIGVIIATLPVLLAAILSRARSFKDAVEWTGILNDIFAIELLLLVILPPLFIASSIGDEIEDRTTTYLWSRPVARWTILGGKLLGLAPVVMLLMVGNWVVAVYVGANHMPPLAPTLSLAAVALAACFISAGLGTLVPKHGMAVSVIYMLVIDLIVGTIPASLQIISVTYNARMLSQLGGLGRSLSDQSSTTSVIAMTVVAVVWLAIGFRRIRRLES